MRESGYIKRDNPLISILILMGLLLVVGVCVHATKAPEPVSTNITPPLLNTTDTVVTEKVKTPTPTKHYQAPTRVYAKKKVYKTNYRRGKGTGDCWDNSETLYNSIRSKGGQARIIQYSTSQSNRHRSVQVYKNGEWSNYDYKSNGYSSRYYATINSKNGVVIK